VSAPLLGREQILAVLRDLAEELDRRGVRAEVFMVGGAALTLAYDTRRATRDVDAIFEPKQTVYEAARRVADKHGLPEDWLNDAVKGFLHGDDPDAVPVLDMPGLRVDVASARYLLAMKLLAARDEDVDDILFLYRLCGFQTVDEGLDLVEAAYPGTKIPVRVQYLLEEHFSSPSEQ
jgi:predicted nucleotidyltransferase